MKYVAFLRGINVGGNKKVSMEELKKSLTLAGFTDVKTLLNSGNVVLESSENNLETITKKITSVLEKAFGFSIHCIVHPQKDITDLVASDPFKQIKMTSDIRLYITFTTTQPKSNLKIPYISEDTSFHILKLTDDAVISVLDLSKGKGTTDMMNIVEKAYGKDITTRNWNTIVKLASL